jgi:choline dehydrogenase-like flavoprotein
MTIVGAVISPLSRGTVTLNSSDPFQRPNINPNLLGSPFDAYVLVQALKAAERFTHADAFKGYIVKRSEEWEHINTDAELEHYARQNAGTYVSANLVSIDVL